MRPGHLQWATDLLYPAGADPWSAQPNKIRPPDGKVATGRVPTELPPAPETNFWRWAVSQALEAASSVRPANLLEDSAALLTGPDFLVGELGSFYFDDILGIGREPWHCYIGSDTVGTITYIAVQQPGERQWGNAWRVDDAGDPATDPTRPAASRDGWLAVGLSSVVRMVRRTTYAGVWSTWAVGLPGGYTVWQIACDHGPAPADRWVVSSLDGAAPYFAVGAAAPGNWTVAATPPAWTAVGGRLILRSSQHRPGDVWPTDPGNPVFLLAHPTNGEVSRSVDGSVWSAVAATLPGAILDVAYGAWSSLWVAVAATNPASQIYLSRDNGATWSAEVVFAGSGIDLTAGGARVQIASDQAGTWTAILTDGASPPELWASVDDAVTWSRVYSDGLRAVTLSARPSLIYSHGQIVYFEHDQTSNMYAASSLRML